MNHFTRAQSKLFLFCLILDTFTMLEFQRQILTEIVSEDGLLIMSPGLGLFEILCNLIQIYTGGNHFVLVVNISQDEHELIQRQLVAKGVPYEQTIKHIEYNTSAEQR